jgi:GNAT superfamily N-acetyltransferase
MCTTSPAAEFSCYPASPSELTTMMALYRDSFNDDPVFQWAFPDNATRRPLLAKFFDIMVGHTFAHGGSALQTEDYGAISTYFPPDAVEQPEETTEELLRSLRRELGSEAENIIVLLGLLDTVHPRDLGPHYYGTFVAAQPRHQNNGLGTRLKRSIFALADQDNAGAYAEASSRRNLALYERLGQRQLGNTITLPGGPQIFPIWRPPRTTADLPESPSTTVG